MDDERHRHRGGLGINLRRSAYTRLLTVAQANNTTWCLKNNSPIFELILVWSFSSNAALSTGDFIGFSQQRTVPAFVATATTFAIVPTDAPPSGQVGYFNSLTQFTPSWAWYNSTDLTVFDKNSPFTVLPPGWNLCVQDLTTATNPLDLSVWWEAMTPEEFEYRYGDTGLAVKRPAGAI